MPAAIASHDRQECPSSVAAQPSTSSGQALAKNARMGAPSVEMVQASITLKVGYPPQSASIATGAVRTVTTPNPPHADPVCLDAFFFFFFFSFCG